MTAEQLMCTHWLTFSAVRWPRSWSPFGTFLASHSLAPLQFQNQSTRHALRPGNSPNSTCCRAGLLRHPHAPVLQGSGRGVPALESCPVPLQPDRCTGLWRWRLLRVQTTLWAPSRLVSLRLQVYFMLLSLCAVKSTPTYGDPMNERSPKYPVILEEGV